MSVSEDGWVLLRKISRLPAEIPKIVKYQILDFKTKTFLLFNLVIEAIDKACITLVGVQVFLLILLIRRGGNSLGVTLTMSIVN